MTDATSFISHLIELRTRLIRAVLGIVVAFLCLFPFANKLYTLLAQPLLAKLPAGGHLIATAVTTPFLVPLKVAFATAMLVSLPYTLTQIWGFVAPGLYVHEKRFIAPLVVISTLLFFVGMSFAYFVVFPVVFGFFVATAPEGVQVMTDIGNYLDFVITLFIAFGVAFEVPVIVVALVKFGWVSVANLKEIRPYAIVGAFILGAIFTPPDVVSQLMLAIPLWILFELGVLAASWVKPAGSNAIGVEDT
ncbi:MAG: twin-arginine translocase subunit TatC [Methylophilaceae bacterium]